MLKIRKHMKINLKKKTCVFAILFGMTCSFFTGIRSRADELSENTDMYTATETDTYHTTTNISIDTDAGCEENVEVHKTGSLLVYSTISPEYSYVQSFVTRLYEKCLDREPDEEGINTWMDMLMSKTGTGASVAKGFVYSKEYIGKNVSDEEYLNMLYRVFLDREADAEGKSTWLDLMEEGLSRDYVFRGFVESPEYTNICKSYNIERGTVTLTQPRDKNPNITKFVNRLYVYALGRNGEADGLNDWCRALQNKLYTPVQVGEFFVLSPEFQAKKLSDEEYIKVLYRAYLGREYDEEGLSTWLELLRSGTSRKNVLRGFTNSVEFGKIIESFGLNKEIWSITQYADLSGSQANFYTITSTNGKLIVIDGGTVKNAQYVKKVINENGGYVNAWILTHPHPDHIGAFNVLYNDESIDIDRIYDNGLDYDYYDTVDYWWDKIETYKTYLAQTEGDERVVHVTSGEEINIGILNIKILHSYSDDLKNWVVGICNNSSLVFKVSLDAPESKSMLFLSDNTGKVMADYLIGKLGNELKADYVNMGHHGNNSLPIYFYEYVSPEMIFFDAPRWLVEGEKYDTLINMAGLDAVGIAHVDYGTAPNKIILN